MLPSGRSINALANVLRCLETARLTNRGKSVEGTRDERDQLEWADRRAMADEFGVDYDLADQLYHRALAQTPNEPRRRADTYRQLLEQAQWSHRSPGKVTRSMRSATTPRRGPKRARVPGKRTLTSYLPATPARQAEDIAFALGTAGLAMPKDLQELLGATSGVQPHHDEQPQAGQVSLGASESAAKNTNRDERQLLDAGTRAAIEAATGLALPEIEVAIDPSLRKRQRLGETRGTTMFLAPEIADIDAPLARQVRLHEAAHIAQILSTDRPSASEKAVERDAHAVADAAARGDRRPVEVRADANVAYGFDVAEALGFDPMSLLSEQFPSLAAIVDGGWEGLLGQAGDAAASRVGPLLHATGMEELGPSLTPIVESFQADGLAFGVLTGCCECLEDALDQALTSFDSFLAGDGPSALQSLLVEIQNSSIQPLLDSLELGFEGVRTHLGPIVMPIVKMAQAAGPMVWKWICAQTGLDPTLPPQVAIERKLNVLWTAATAASAPLRAAVTQLSDALAANSLVSGLLNIGQSFVKLGGALGKVKAARSRDPAVWLAILAEELQGTIFEELVGSLQGGHASAMGAAEIADQFFRRILDQLGILSAWNSTVPALHGLAQTVQGFFAKVEGGVALAQHAFAATLKGIGNALGQLYAGVKPLFDFVIGLQLALMTGPVGIAAFVAGQTFRAIPACYQLAITDFLLDLFIRAVEFFPAKTPIFALMKGGALGCLQALRAAPVDQKVGAMEMVARMVSGDVELMAGLTVGFFKGLNSSTLGLVLLPITLLPSAMIAFAKQLTATASSSFETLYESAQWVTELAAGTQQIEGPRKADELSDVLAVGDEAVQTPAAEEVAPVTDDSATEGSEDEGFDPLPPFPGFDVDIGAVFEQIFSGDGVTREDLEGFLAGFNIQADAIGTKIGGSVAEKLLAAFNDESTPYRVGDIVGMVAGWACGEIVIAVLTMGIGTGATATIGGGKLLAALAKGLPKLVEMLVKLKAWIRPLIRAVGKLADEIATAFQKLLKWIDDVIIWARKQIAKLVLWMRSKLGLVSKKPRKGKGGKDADAPVVDKFKMDGEKHTLTVRRKGKGVSVVMRSISGELVTKLTNAEQLAYAAIDQAEARLKEAEPETRAAIGDSLKTLNALRLEFWKLGGTVAEGPGAQDEEKWADQLVTVLVGIGRTYLAKGLDRQDVIDALEAILSMEVDDDRSSDQPSEEQGQSEHPERDSEQPGQAPEQTEYEQRKGTCYDTYRRALDVTQEELYWARDISSAGISGAELATFRAQLNQYLEWANSRWELLNRLGKDMQRASEWYDRGDFGMGAVVFSELTQRAELILDEATLAATSRPQIDWDTNYVQIENGQLMLKPEYRRVRYHFYPHDFSDSTRNRMWLQLDGARAEPNGSTGVATWTYQGALSPRGDYQWLVNDPREMPTIEHENPSVASHWETSGRTSNHRTRRDWYQFRDGRPLVILPKCINSSEGASRNESFTPIVTLSFRGRS